MKVAIAAEEKTIVSRVHDRFGRCPFFILVDLESMGFEALENPGLEERDAAGVQACRMLIGKNVDSVVVRNIGHNSLVTLLGAGIKVYSGATETILSVIEKLKKGDLTRIQRPTVGFQDGLDEME